MPAERPGQDAAEQQSERAADGGDGGVDAYRRGPLVGLRNKWTIIPGRTAAVAAAPAA